MSCIFCDIIKGKLPSQMVYQDEQVVAFYDIKPKAKVHILIVPRKHIASVNQVKLEDRAILGSLFLAARKIAKIEGIAKQGYRLSVNTGALAGQAVYHLHMHLMGGGVFDD